MSDRRAPRGPRPAPAAPAALAVYLVGLAALTFSPQPDDPSAFGWVRRAADWLAASGLPVTFPGLEAVGNVLLFVPFGVLVGLLLGRRRWWLTLLAGSATSAAIEVTQLWIPGRWSTLQDWVLNTVGTGVGLVALALVERRSRRSSEPVPGPADDEGRAPRKDPAPS